MRAAHRAATRLHRGGEHAGDAELLEQQAAADHVGDGVERADLVELDLVGRNSVHRALGLGQDAEDALRARPHRGRQGGALEKLADPVVRAMRDVRDGRAGHRRRGREIDERQGGAGSWRCERGVPMVVVVVVVAITVVMAVPVVAVRMAVGRRRPRRPRRLLIGRDVDAQRADAAHLHARRGQAQRADAEREQVALQALRIAAQLEQAGEQHVAGDPARHLDEQRGHGGDARNGCRLSSG